MAWIEHRGPAFVVRARHGRRKYTDSVHDTATAASMRIMQINNTRLHIRALRTGVVPNLGEWAERWLPAHTAGPSTRKTYESLLRLHLLPALRDARLDQVDHATVERFADALSGKGLALRTVRNIVTLLGTMLRDAVDAGRLLQNPARGIRLNYPPRQPRPLVTPAQVLQLAARMPTPALRAMVITGGYTGMRYGEHAGLQHIYLRFADPQTGERPYLYVHPTHGALHTEDGPPRLGMVKTPASARYIFLPPFLADLLAQLTRWEVTATVFCSRAGDLLRRTEFDPAWRAACDGDPDRGWEPILPGLRFHDLRHAHRTWMDEHHIDEIVQAARLGHRLRRRPRPPLQTLAQMQQPLLDMLQKRWDKAPAP